MPATIHIPGSLRPQAENKATISVTAATVREALLALTTQYPELGKKLFKSGEQVNRFINIYVNDEDIRFSDNLATPLKDGDALLIEIAVAGG
jgi:molybdopterin synthase sulfur carrier subunit